MQTATSHMSQEELYQLSVEVMPGGAGVGAYAMPDDARFIINRGEGSKLLSTDGKWYIDYVGGAGALIIGHAFPSVVVAAQETVAKGLHLYGTLNEPAIEYAKVLVDAIPCADQIVYATTGSEATFYAMRIARAYTGRSKIVKCEGAYHGNHDYSSFSVSPKTLSEYPVGQPDTGGIPDGIREQILIAPYNDLDTVARIFKEHNDEIAALIVEPVQRNIPPQPGYLEGLRELCTEHGIVMIFDEVVTGFRLAYGGAQEFFGVTPDLATYGKIVGGGGPGSVVAGRKEIMSQADPIIRGQDAYAYVNGTLHGNPIGCAAGMATLQELRTPGFYDRLHDRTATFKSSLQSILDSHGLEVRAWGTGSLWQTVFMDKVPTRHADMMKADMALTKELDRQLLLRGIYVLPGVRRFVSSVHTDDDFAVTYEAFEDACRTVKSTLSR